MAYLSLGDILEALVKHRLSMLLSRCHMSLHLNFMDSVRCRRWIIFSDRCMETPRVRRNFFFILDGKICDMGKGCMVE